MSSRHASKRQRKAPRNARRLHVEHLESRIVLANATSFEFNDTNGLFLATPPALEDPIPEPIPDSSLDVKLTPVASGLTAPNWGAAAPGIDDRLFVTDQTGELWSAFQALDKTA